jgi:hypothetical protein
LGLTIFNPTLAIAMFPSRNHPAFKHGVITGLVPGCEMAAAIDQTGFCRSGFSFFNDQWSRDCQLMKMNGTIGDPASYEEVIG